MTGLLRSTWRVLASKEEKPMDLMDATSGKYAVKRYKADCPSEYQIRQLIDAAVMAPGAVDGQSWHFTVITNAEMLDTISARTKSWIFHHEPWLLEGGERTWPLNDANFHLLHHAPVLIVIAAPSKDKWSAEICVVAAQNLMLAATAHGLAACWIGLAQNWLNSPAGRTAVGLPDDVRVIAPIVIGYPAGSPEPIARRHSTITWIRDESRVVEDGEPAEPVSTHGLFGGLVVPEPERLDP